MNPELDKKLCDKYPKIFRDRHAPMSQTAICWGLECGNGWENIIDAMCEAMTYTYTTGLFLNEEDQKKYGTDYLSIEAPQVVATQVKEKFATLRFYYRLEFDPVVNEICQSDKYPELQRIIDLYSVYMDGIVHMAEVLSARTCEETGKPGELHVSGGNRYGWLKTLNKEFAKTDPHCIERGYVPMADLDKKEEEKK